MDESKNPNSTLWQMMPKLLCFKDAEKFNYLFFYFWLDLFFTSYYGVALVNWFWCGARSWLLNGQSL